MTDILTSLSGELSLLFLGAVAWGMWADRKQRRQQHKAQMRANRRKSRVIW
jgi:hypothetical protein